MSSYSQVYLKTTTEGYIILKRLDNSITKTSDKPLSKAVIQRTASGFYKISFDDIKWYEGGGYENVENFMKGLELLKKQDIPYSFIRLGEEVWDIVHEYNWTSDMPSAISSFEPLVDINDEDWKDYEEIKE